ncbi:hypothetical protein P3T35_008129, partial [Kitasatospora sp. GP30]|nr:hypothetical protein [Kitasatospora sp. GP30]
MPAATLYGLLLPAACCLPPAFRFPLSEGPVGSVQGQVHMDW